MAVNGFDKGGRASDPRRSAMFQGRGSWMSASRSPYQGSAVGEPSPGGGSWLLVTRDAVEMRPGTQHQPSVGNRHRIDDWVAVGEHFVQLLLW